MSKLIIALIFSIASTSYAATVENKEGRSVKNSENPQIQKQQNQVDKDSNKTSSVKARETKSKDKGMHIKDEVTDLKQNEPRDAVETKSSGPKVDQK